jgi:hypothetical protein
LGKTRTRRFAGFLGDKRIGWPALGLQSFDFEGAPMRITLILIASVCAFLSGTQGASAFSTRQVDPVTANNRLADPDELADKMSNGRWIAKNPPEAYRDN